MPMAPERRLAGGRLVMAGGPVAASGSALTDEG